MEVGQGIDVAPSVRPQHLDLAVEERSVAHEAIEEQPLEVSADRCPVDEGPAEHHRCRTKQSIAEAQAEHGGGHRETTERKEESNQPRVVVRDLGSREHQRRHLVRSVGDQAPSDHAAAVVGDHRVSVESERIDRFAEAAHEGVELQRNAGIHDRFTRPRQIDEVTGESRECRGDVAPDLAVQRPAVDEDDVGTATDLAVADPAVGDLDERLGCHGFERTQPVDRWR